MAKSDPGSNNGRWQKGVSGNPSGIAKPRADAAPGGPGTEVAKPRKDGWMNSFTGHGVFGRDKRQGTSFTTAVLSFESLAELWRGDDLAARAVETLPKEALREGYDLLVPQTEDDDDAGAESDRIAEVMDKLDKLGVDQILRTALGYERGIGGGAVLIGANDKQTDLTTPLDLSKVTSLDWLTPLEARELYPVYGYADPRAPKYGLPEIYRLTSRAILPPQNGAFSQTVMDIHESRLCVFPGIRVSRYQSMASQGGWGDSVLIRMWRVLRDFNLAWGSAGTLVTDFAKGVYKMADLWDTLATADGESSFAARLASMDLASSTINATIIDGKDDYKRDSTPIAGLPDLMDKFATRLSAAADLPLTLLFGTSPAGLNATGESDIRFFYDRVASYQRDKILPHLMKLIEIIFRTTGDKQVPEKWSVRFKPLWQESAADRAKAQLTVAQADHVWITDGVYSAEEAADSHWGTGEFQPEITIDFDARKKQQMATSSPVGAKDLDAMGKPINPNFNPPAQSTDPAAPNYTAPEPEVGDEPADALTAQEKVDAAEPFTSAIQQTIAKKKKIKGFKDYVPPPAQGTAKATAPTTPPGKAAAPDPNERPQGWVQSDRADVGRADYSEDEPRAADGKWGSGGASTANPDPSTGADRGTGRGQSSSHASMPDGEHAGAHASPDKSVGAAPAHPAAHAQEVAKQTPAEAMYGMPSKYAEKDPEPAGVHTEPASHTARALLAYAAESEAAGRGAGFTFNPGDKKFVTEGYAVSTHPGHELLIHGHDVNEAELQKYISNPERDRLFKDDPKATIGGWYDPERDEWNLDVSHVESNRATAVQFAQQYNQRGIYDLKRGETINANEYEQAIAGTGKFAGRTDSATARGEGTLRPTKHVSRRDRGSDERDPGQRTGEARRSITTWVGWHTDSDDLHLDSDSIADAVNEQLKEDYRPADRKWILDTIWEGPVRIPVEQIDWSGRKGWQASQEDDEDHVAKFVKRIKQGWDKPIILVARPGFAKYFVVDGHHRALAYRQVDCPALAYVGKVPAPDGPWNSFHDLQKPKTDAKAPTIDPPAQPRTDDFNEALHPRAADGRFGEGAGTAKSWKGEGASAKSTVEAFKKGGSYRPDREELHKNYTKKAIEGVPDSDKPTVYMTGGGPASGKSSVILENPDAGFPDRKHAAFINPDEALEHLPEYKAGVAAGAAGAASFTHDESVDMSKDAIAEALHQHKDVVFDSTGDGGIKELTAKVDALRKNGAQRVVANYVTVNPDTAVQRSDKRAAETGRHVPAEVVRGIHTLVSRTAVKAIKAGVFDEAKVWDNNAQKPRLIAEYDRGGGLKIHDQAAWDNFVGYSKVQLPLGWSDE